MRGRRRSRSHVAARPDRRLALRVGGGARPMAMRSGRGGAVAISSSGCAEMYSPSSSNVQPTTTMTASAVARDASSPRRDPSRRPRAPPRRAAPRAARRAASRPMAGRRCSSRGRQGWRSRRAARARRRVSACLHPAAAAGRRCRTFFSSTIDFAAASYASARCSADAQIGSVRGRTRQDVVEAQERLDDTQRPAGRCLPRTARLRRAHAAGAACAAGGTASRCRGPRRTDFTASRSPKIQSEMTNPWKPHSSRRISVSSTSFSPHHAPLTELYADMTQATPSSMTRLKCGRYTSCSARSSAWTSTLKRAFSIEFSAKCFTHAIACRCTPRASAAPISPTWCGSSPYVSCARPHAGWRSRFTLTPPNSVAPRRAQLEPDRLADALFQVRIPRRAARHGDREAGVAADDDAPRAIREGDSREADARQLRRRSRAGRCTRRPRPGLRLARPCARGPARTPRRRPGTRASRQA